MAKINELNQDVLLMIASFLSNRELACFAFSFASAFRISNYRSYWRAKPSTFNVRRIAGWDDYSIEELRVASLRGFLAWSNWTSARPEPKKIYSGAHDRGCMKMLTGSRWIITWNILSLWMNIRFTDIVSGRMTNTIQFPWTGRMHDLHDHVSSVSPAEFIMRFITSVSGSFKASFLRIKIHQDENRLLYAFATPLRGLDLPSGSWTSSFGTKYALQITNDPLKAQELDRISLVDLTANHQYHWEVLTGYQRLVTYLTENWLFVIVVTDSVRLTCLDLSKVSTSLLEASVTRLPLGVVVSTLPYDGICGADFCVDNDDITLKMTLYYSGYFWLLGYSIQCIPSSDSVGNVTITLCHTCASNGIESMIRPFMDCVHIVYVQGRADDMTVIFRTVVDNLYTRDYEWRLSNDKWCRDRDPGSDIHVWPVTEGQILIGTWKKSRYVYKLYRF